MSTPMQHIFKPKDTVFSTPLRPITTDTTVRTPLDPKVPAETYDTSHMAEDEAVKSVRRNRLQRAVSKT